MLSNGQILPRDDKLTTKNTTGQFSRPFHDTQGGTRQIADGARVSRAIIQYLALGTVGGSLLSSWERTVPG